VLHTMKLNDEPFGMIVNGRKTVELRLNDEKRRKVRPGDFIEFTHISIPEQKVTVRVTELYHYDSFPELLSALPKESCGFAPEDTVPPDYMDAFYPPEEQKRYGALGIGFRLTGLQKFIDAQEHGYEAGEVYPTAFAEIRAGKKDTHWMWYVFPQIHGLGYDATTEYFALSGIDEARDYLDHPVLGVRLRDITAELMKLGTDDPMVVFGYPDAYKLRSCMTLFVHAAPEEELFRSVLEKYCMGTEDDDTLTILGIDQ